MASSGTGVIKSKAEHEKCVRMAESAWNAYTQRHAKREAAIFGYALEQIQKNKPNYSYLDAVCNMAFFPVTIDEFIESEEFLSCDPEFKVWSTLREDLRKINTDIWTGEKKILEAFDGGATSTGKTHIASITQAYQLYQMCCFKKPVKLWPQLSSKTPLVFMFQSVQESITKRVIYEPFKAMFTDMPFIQKNAVWNRDKDAALEFDNNVMVVPALASLQKMVGQAIVSCLLDEVNFMSVVKESKQVIGNRGQGGLYDQAELVYNNIVRRRKSRFETNGPEPGVISVLSSTRYLGDFMDRRVKEIEANNEKDVHVMRRKQYEAQPGGNEGPRTRVLVGSLEYGTRVLKDDEVKGKHYPASATVLEVPVKYKVQFMRDPEGALRDVCGIATDVIAPFITQRHKIIESIVRGTKLGLKPWVQKADVDLAIDGMPQIIEENLPLDRKRPRFVHVDLSRTRDRCGIAILKVLGQQAVADANGTVEYLPHYCLEQGITIKPSQSAEIDLPDIRKFIMTLKEYYKINIHTVSYDGFDSRETMQLLRKAGIFAWEVSVDETLEPYEMLKSALYQDRIDFQDHELLKVELAGLEMNSKAHQGKGKVDHPPSGSKDLADALAGAIYSASQNRTVRAATDVVNNKGEQAGTMQDRSRVTVRSRSPHRRRR